MDKKIFDPMAWASASEAPKAEHVNYQQNSELEKAKATTDELLRIGANIAESYDDYLHLGFALADGLGADGRELYHQLCAQSTKYRAKDCETKWQECLSKGNGSVTIATYYKMAQDAGVNLKEVFARHYQLNENYNI